MLTNPKRNAIYFFFVMVMFVVWSATAFIVDQTQMAAVFQFGKPVRDITTPGLYFKAPWPIQTVSFVDKRYFIYDSSPKEVITRDKKTLVVDDFAAVRITNPTIFLQTAQTVEKAQHRIDDIIYSELKTRMGAKGYQEIVVEEREAILESVTTRCETALGAYALTTQAVRVNRVDLPSENQKAVYGRMQAERQQQAMLYRSEGEEESKRIMSDADRERTFTLAEAKKQADLIRGAGEAKAAKTYNDAFGKDPDFFSFIRSLQSADATLQGDGVRLILRGDEPHLKHLFSKK